MKSLSSFIGDDEEKHFYDFHMERSEYFEVPAFITDDQGNKIFIIRIGKSLFVKATKITNICFSIDSKVSIFESQTFIHCGNLRSIRIPASLYKICKTAFCDCNSLKHIDFDQNSRLEIIEPLAFIVTKIKKIVFPSTVKTLHQKQMCGFERLQSLKFNGEHRLYKVSDDDQIITKGYPGFVFAPRNRRRVLIRRGIETIFPESFEGSITAQMCFPASVKRICQMSFQYCAFLKSISFAQNSKLEIIESYSFNFCRNLEKAFFPSSLRIIEEGSFQYCQNLSKIVFQNESKLESISSIAFMNHFFRIIEFPIHIMPIICTGIPFAQPHALRVIETNEKIK